MPRLSLDIRLIPDQKEMERVGKSNQGRGVNDEELDQLVDHLKHHEGEDPDGGESSDHQRHLDPGAEDGNDGKGLLDLVSLWPDDENEVNPGAEKRDHLENVFLGPEIPQTCILQLQELPSSKKYKAEHRERIDKPPNWDLPTITVSFMEKLLDRPVSILTLAACRVSGILTSFVSFVLHRRSPVHKSSEGHQVEEEGENVDLEEVVGRQALQVDERLCQGVGQQALSAKLQECRQDFTFRR